MVREREVQGDAEGGEGVEAEYHAAQQSHHVVRALCSVGEDSQDGAHDREGGGDAACPSADGGSGPGDGQHKDDCGEHAIGQFMGVGGRCGFLRGCGREQSGGKPQHCQDDGQCQVKRWEPGQKQTR